MTPSPPAVAPELGRKAALVFARWMEARGVPYEVLFPASRRATYVYTLSNRNPAISHLVAWSALDRSSCSRTTREGLAVGARHQGAVRPRARRWHLPADPWQTPSCCRCPVEAEGAVQELPAADKEFHTFSNFQVSPPLDLPLRSVLSWSRYIHHVSLDFMYDIFSHAHAMSRIFESYGCQPDPDSQTALHFLQKLLVNSAIHKYPTFLRGPCRIGRQGRPWRPAGVLR